MARPLRIEYAGAVYHITSSVIGASKYFQKLEELFTKEKTTDRQKRDKQIYKANIQYGYSLKEIADYLGVHYTTVSKALKGFFEFKKLIIQDLTAYLVS